MNYYFPPAKASFNWWQVVVGSFFNKQPFSSIVRNYLSAKEVIIGNTWVPLLAEGLKGLAKGEDRKQILLPGYSCNEFTKAILLAGLEPIYFDINENGQIDVAQLHTLDTALVLGLLVVNTSGVISDFTAIKSWCDRVGCYMIEDAGYTFLGEDNNGKPFGSFGHFTIINMSEGKIIPCGGAAWVVNDLAGKQKIWQEMKAMISSLTPVSNFNEAIRLLIYKIGSSRWGFHIYQLLRSFGFADLKSMFTSEPSRLGENYITGNLNWNDGKILLDKAHAQYLSFIKIRPWNRIKNSCALYIFSKRNEMQKMRFDKLNLYQSLLKANTLVLPNGSMPVKLPILLQAGTFEIQNLLTLEKLGVKKQYPPSWPMARLSLLNSIRFYHEAFTLPLHESIDYEDIRKICLELNKSLVGVKNQIFQSKTD
jgi:dTDP-4-amino-4,6-dideoxygalactose transaminase